MKTRRKSRPKSNDGWSARRNTAGRGAQAALVVIALVALAGCGAAAGGPAAGVVMLTLSLVLGLGGCMRSHGADDRIDQDEDGHPRSEDCDDEDPDIYPGAHDVGGGCEGEGDGIDNDCDGRIDEDVVSCNPIPDVDEDGDGYPVHEDCDDLDPDIHPGAADEGGGCEELGDGIDNDCDGSVDEDVVSCNPLPDYDGDGYTADVDCDDEDPEIHPDAEEQCCDDVDSNCDGEDDPPEAFCNCFGG